MREAESRPDRVLDSPADWRAIARELTAWYAANHRRLPWRPAPGELGEPYRVMVSEAMLQQTQVATVVNFFQRFLIRFPDVASLAAAAEQDVLSAWQGLGYYRRARHLHQAARRIIDEHGGIIPDDPAAIRALPGVGDYTAGAIASIAFARRAPILDGNVARVMARLLAIEAPIDAAATRKRLWAAARAAVEAAEHPGDLNQALMELGATVCLPRGPRCLTCPVRRWCDAAAKGLAETLPKRGQRSAARPVVHDVLAIRRRGKWLVEQRGANGLWAGMWQLVTREEPADDDLPAWAVERYGLRVGAPVETGRFEHLTTHKRITFRLFIAEVEAGRLRPNAGAWRTLDRMGELPMSNAQRKAIALLREALSG